MPLVTLNPAPDTDKVREVVVPDAVRESIPLEPGSDNPELPPPPDITAHVPFLRNTAVSAIEPVALNESTGIVPVP